MAIVTLTDALLQRLRSGDRRIIRDLSAYAAECRPLGIITALRSLPYRASRGKGYTLGAILNLPTAAMNITLSLAPLVSLLAGVLILMAPRLLNYIVAVYLIVFGLLGIFGDVHLR